jgi:hypothetical protein
MKNYSYKNYLMWLFCISLVFLIPQVCNSHGHKTSVEMGFDGIINGNDSLSVRPDITRSAFGESLVGQLFPQFQGSFEYTVSNTELNTNTVVNGGTITQDAGMAVCTTSTTTGSSALFQSRRHAKYRPGLGGASRFTALFTTPVAGTQQCIGIADEVGSSVAFKNGYMVGYIGTVFAIHRFSNDTVETVAQADWDDPMDGSGASGMILDQTKLNVFQIQYQYLGAGDIFFYVEDDLTGEFTKIHTLHYANRNTEPSVYNPNFHHTMWASNLATSSNIILKSSSYAYFIEGKTSFIELQQPQFSTGTVEKTLVTTEVAIFTVRVKSSYAGKTNFIDIFPEFLSVAIEASSANNIGGVRLVKNATLGGSPSYSDINTTDSVVEIDTAGTTVTGGIELFTTLLAGKNDKILQDLSNLHIILGDGDTLTIAALSANSATFDAALLWRELF